MIDFEPKFITFDCYGTLTAFGMSAVTRELLADRVPAQQMEDFLDDFEAFRGDEVLGAYKPYRDVINDSLARTAKLWGVEHRDSDAQAIYESVPSWGPHPDVPDPLAALAERYPLVILSNAADEQIQSNVDKLGAPFHAVYTAGRHPARLLEPALRPDARPRPAGDQQGLRQPRLRAQHALLRLPRGQGHRRPRRAARRLSPGSGGPTPSRPPGPQPSWPSMYSNAWSRGL
jgi:2-haloalkanoic acid dehalogenase type II